MANLRLVSRGDAEDVVLQALQSSSPNAVGDRQEANSAKNMFELFAPLRGLNIDFEADRKKDAGRDGLHEIEQAIVSLTAQELEAVFMA